jgi:hypothetical protein
VRSKSIALIAVLIAAAGLRLLRMHVRWDEIALAYAAYAEPLTQAIIDGHPTALLGSWIGLHPPLWGTIHALMEVYLPIPWAWMGFSALCSWLAVYVVGRRGGIAAALVLATAPVHLLDGAEVNNYPMSSLAVALLVVTARGHWWTLALVAVFAAWSHLLVGVGAAAVILWRLLSLRTVHRTALLFWVAVGMLPIAGGAARLMGQRSTWAQPNVEWMAWVELLAHSIGPEGLLLIPLVWMGMRGPLLVAWASMAGALVFAVGFDAAAAHQRPYLGLLAPIAALAIAETVRKRPWTLWVVVLLCTVRGTRFALDDVTRFKEVVADQAVLRGVDVAMEGAVPGDTVWLVSPALQTDDDKTAFSTVLWRFRPWKSMPISRPVDFEYKDYSYGQPRKIDGIDVHTSTELDPAPFDHIAQAALDRGHRVWLVLYDHGPASGLEARVRRVLSPYDVVWTRVGSETRSLGVDLVGRVEVRR